MIDHGRYPKKWAANLQTLLTAFAGEDRFPVNVTQLALDYSRQAFPNEPVRGVKGESIPGFEGALYPLEDVSGWAIVYNSAVSPGRRRFTIAHEFGHYLMHRSLMPKGFQCDESAVTFRDGADLEQEADTFAAYLLMPLDDYRKQIPPDAKPTLEELSALAERYGVSLIAVTLRWLEYTERRSMLVIGREGYVLWAKPSEPALKTGRYFRTRGDAPPIEIPSNAIALRSDLADLAREGVQHPAGVWFEEECLEYSVQSDRYDQTISLLHFPKYAPSRFDYLKART